MVHKLGSISKPWIVEAVIKSPSGNVKLQGNTTVAFKHGWANFSNIWIDKKGKYILSFKVIEPTNKSKFVVDSSNLEVCFISSTCCLTPTSVVHW